MSYQRVDKKHPKIVPDNDLKGFCFKRVDKVTKIYVEINDDAVFIKEPQSSKNELTECSLVYLEKDDIPNMVKALWAAYAVIEKDQQEGVL